MNAQQLLPLIFGGGSNLSSLDETEEEKEARRRREVLARWRSAPTDPVLLFRDPPLKLVAQLEERRVILRGLVVQTEPKRRYPFGPMVAHAIGYVGEISERELEERSFPGARFGALVGRGGLEQQYDERLGGSDGVRKYRRLSE